MEADNIGELLHGKMCELQGDEQESLTLAGVDEDVASHMQAQRATETIERMECAEETPQNTISVMLPEAHMSGSSGSTMELRPQRLTPHSVEGFRAVHAVGESISMGDATSGTAYLKLGFAQDLSRKRLREESSIQVLHDDLAKHRAITEMTLSLNHPAYKLYLQLDGRQRRLLNKAFSMKKARFMQKLVSGEPVEIGDQTVRLGLGGECKYGVAENKMLFRQWLRSEIHSGQLPKDLLGLYIAQLVAIDRATYFHDHVRQICLKERILLTWNGPWGCLFHVDNKQTVRDNMEIIIEQARARTESLWALFQQFVRVCATTYKAVHHAESLELCVRSATTTGLVRVHLHAWFEFGTGQETEGKIVNVMDFIFKGSKPLAVPFQLPNCASSKNIFAGAFYLTAPKIGLIRSSSSATMFEDYSPPTTWITGMVVAAKMEVKCAEKLYAMCVVSAKHNIETLRYVQSSVVEQRRAEERLRVEHQIRATQRPFKTIEAVTTWLKQYEEIRDRYLFLVLDGESMYGKSRFAANLTMPEKFLSVDCASATEPELRSFDREQHDVVCFDEAKPSMIIRVKKLAQAGVDPARLGQSATNQVSYQVWFHRVKLIICSNRWEQELRDVTREDVAWLGKNSVYVKVTAPLFE